MDFPVHIPFVQHLGFELLRFEGGEAEIALDLRAEQCNSFLVAHGGVTMTLLDVVMAHAARSVNRELDGGGPGVVTIEMKTTFMRPAERALRAVGKVLHKTRSMAFCEAHMVDAEGTLVAHASGTFKYIRPRSPAAKASVPNNPNQDSA